jgi:excisionase family DNA binding protein
MAQREQSEARRADVPEHGTQRTLDGLPAVLDLPQAAELLGIGRTMAYQLVHAGEWPTPILRIGRLIKVPTDPIVALLRGRATS